MIIILVMHGMPPKDFPEAEKKEFMRLHAQVDHGPSCDGDSPQKVRHDELDHKMRSWPRTPENDAFHEASYKIAEELQAQSGSEVIVGFNEFCAPDVDAAIDEAVSKGEKEIIVTTPMVTRGGSHAEFEIPEIIEEARKRYPEVLLSYAWPFEEALTAKFLADQIKKFSNQPR